MNGRMAKRLRAAVYGVDGASRLRQWESARKPVVTVYRIVDHVGNMIGQTVRRIWSDRVTADPLRRAYQALKRARRGQSWRTV